MRLDRIELPVRLVNALMNMGLKTVGDVRNLRDVKLRSAPGIGQDSFRLLRSMFGPSRHFR